MSSIKNKNRLRREKNILDRIENVKRLIQMETTLLTTESARKWVSYQFVDKENKYRSQNLLNELRDEIQMQLLSITALCYGDNPDCGEPVPMLEWKPINDEERRHPSDKFRDVWDECLGWNA